GWVGLNGEPISANDVRRDPRFLATIDATTQFDTRSILAAPLKVDDRVIGVIEMLNKHSGPFTQTDCDLLVEFGKWAAIALHNAQLYQEMHEAKERLANDAAFALIGDLGL